MDVELFVVIAEDQTAERQYEEIIHREFPLSRYVSKSVIDQEFTSLGSTLGERFDKLLFDNPKIIPSNIYFFFSLQLQKIGQLISGNSLTIGFWATFHRTWYQSGQSEAKNSLNIMLTELHVSIVSSIVSSFPSLVTIRINIALKVNSSNLFGV